MKNFKNEFIVIIDNNIMKSQYIENFTEKDKPVDSFFAVKEKQSVHTYTKEQSKYMFTLKISDKTGEMNLNYFGGDNQEEVKSVYQTFEVQDIVHIKGNTNYYNGINIVVNPDTGFISKTDEFDVSDFLPMTKKDISQMVSQLKDIISKIENNDIKRLLESIFNDDNFMEKYSKSAAASFYHHNFGGGLIEHVLNMIQISMRFVEMHPELDKDLLIAGCIFHDIGKVNELKASTSIVYTTEGNLLGHISMGQTMTNNWIDKLENFPDILKQKILHMILSHHGEKKLGSPVEPLFPEAMALHHIDYLDSSVQTALQKKENANKDDEWLRDYKGFPTMYLE